MIKRINGLTVAVVMLATAGYLCAQRNLPEGEGAQKPLSPYFLIEDAGGSAKQFPLKSTDIVVDVNGVIAGVTVIQRYENNGSRPVNGSYIFPASTRAAVHGMTMRIGNRVVRAMVKKREVAQQIFEQAKEEGKSASLLEQQRPNVFSMKVSNIMPGDVIEIELSYTEYIVPVEGIYEFVYPTVVGPRYPSGHRDGGPQSDEWVKNPYTKGDDAPASKWTISTIVSTGVPLRGLECTTHKTLISWEKESVARVELDDSEINGGNRDFILRYRLRGREIRSGLMLYEGDHENFFLLTVQPPERVPVAEILPREYMFVVDVSGSMNGFPITTAKELLRDLIGHLRPDDRFNVLLFAGASELMAPVSVAATEKNLNRALQLIDRQQGGGGTELAPALTRALALPADEQYSRTVVIVTDGFISGEREVFSFIRGNLGTANIFPFGIGSSVNRYLIEGIARAGCGEPFIATDAASAGETATRFRRYIASPVLADISIDFDGFDAYGVEPQAFSDLFAQRPLVVFGKYHGSRPSGTITINGRSAGGPFKKEIKVRASRPIAENSTLAYLWARTRIENLEDRIGTIDDSERENEITTLGLTYNLLTQNTSFVAVLDEKRNGGEKAQDVKQPLPLPQGVSEFAVGGGMKKMAEPGAAELAGVAVLVVLAVYRRRRHLPCTASDKKFDRRTR